MRPSAVQVGHIPHQPTDLSGLYGRTTQVRHSESPSLLHPAPASASPCLGAPLPSPPGDHLAAPITISTCGLLSFHSAESTAFLLPCTCLVPFLLFTKNLAPLRRAPSVALCAADSWTALDSASSASALLLHQSVGHAGQCTHWTNGRWSCSCHGDTPGAPSFPPSSSGPRCSPGRPFLHSELLCARSQRTAHVSRSACCSVALLLLNGPRVSQPCTGRSRPGYTRASLLMSGALLLGPTRLCPCCCALQAWSSLRRNCARWSPGHLDADSSP